MFKNKNAIGSLNLIKYIFKYLSKKRKIQLFLTLIFGFSSGLAEMINLSAVIPFLIIITDPKKISDIPYFFKFTKNIKCHMFKIVNQINNFAFFISLIIRLLKKRN